MSTERSTPSLLGDVIEQVVDLMQAELRLLRTELDEKFNQALRSVWLMAGGAGLLIAAIMLFVGALVDYLAASGMPRYQAGLIVGACIAALGAILIVVARNSLTLARLEPRRTFDQLRKDISVAKAQVKG